MGPCREHVHVLSRGGSEVGGGAGCVRGVRGGEEAGAHDVQSVAPGVVSWERGPLARNGPKARKAPTGATHPSRPLSRTKRVALGVMSWERGRLGVPCKGTPSRRVKFPPGKCRSSRSPSQRLCRQRSSRSVRQSARDSASLQAVTRSERRAGPDNGECASRSHRDREKAAVGRGSERHEHPPDCAGGVAAAGMDKGGWATREAPVGGRWRSGPTAAPRGAESVGRGGAEGRQRAALGPPGSEGTRPAVGEGMLAERAGCGRAARAVRRAATGNRAMAWTEAPATGESRRQQRLSTDLTPPRQSSTLLCIIASGWDARSLRKHRQRGTLLHRYRRVEAQGESSGQSSKYRRELKRIHMPS